MIVIGIHLLNRFVSKVQFSDACWYWEGGRNHGGYGKFWAQRATHAAHRFSYELFRGPIPSGLTIDYLCRIRHCVNPDHLEAVPLVENLHRSSLRPESRTHCPQGHPYAGDNLQLVGGERRCRACGNKRSREYQRSPRAHQWQQQYRQRPDVRERHRLAQRAYMQRRRGVTAS